MATPIFIQHYIDQLINDDCVTELNRLARDYEAQRTKIDTLERHEGDRRYKQLTGRESPHSVRAELAALDKQCKDEAKNITAKHAKQEGVTFEEFKEPEPEKSQEQTAKEISEKSAKSGRHLDDIQESMIEKKEAFQQSQSAEPQPEPPKPEQSQEPENSLNTTKTTHVETEELSKEEKRKRDLEEIRRQFEQQRSPERDR